ncbi:MFS transporter [Ramlibacter tataouinensis]|uniref:MFS transporter n=1 Tax=Ramlibacter tataouinensis TaxID=94132 RepID=UPI0022F3CC42|nr:MFS transporter [Ramlibacter tataouinensis]WBY00365.1 MFS transporter [Ramlibacter tataouinensis]
MLRPVPHVSAEQLASGERALVQDLAWASLCGAFSGGVILVAFALTLGATPLQIGLLAAIPFLAQASQLPATLLIERVRLRRRIGVLSVTAARLVILATAVLPFIGGGFALTALIGAQVLIATFNAVGGCAINSWLHQLIPHERLGHFFSRRLFFGTALACVGTLIAGRMVDAAPRGQPMYAYAAAFALAGLAGFVSSWHLGRAPEPAMSAGAPAGRALERLRQPFTHPNFRRLLIFLAAWTIASNFTAPFLTVYLIEQLGYPVGTVTSLWVTSQVSNALTLYLWGRLSDRLSNKGVLAVALPVHFACVLALVFVDAVSGARGQLGLLYVLHFVMGIATGGIALATGNLGLKLAPQGEGTVYLAAIGLASAVAGGIAPVLAGALAQAFQTSELSAVVRWQSPGHWKEMAIFSFAHWEFLFAISALLGLYVIHALYRIEEGREVSERQVVQAFVFEARRSLNSLSSAAFEGLFPFERLNERRKWWRSERRRLREPPRWPEQRILDRRRSA